MAELERGQSEGILIKSWIASKASLNGSCIDREGNLHKLMDAAIDTTRITSLAEYMRAARPDKGKNWDPSLKDDDKLMQVFVVPITLPNGEEIDVIVNKDGQDMGCVFLDEQGEQQFTLTPRMKKEIMEATPSNLEQVVGKSAYENAFFPNNLEEFAEKVSKDELVPQNPKDALRRISGENSSLEQNNNESEKEQAAKEIPEEVRDEIAKFCSEHNYDIGKLKEVMLVAPENLEGKLPNTGISPNGGNVYCLRFSDAQMKDRVVMIQPGKEPVDDRANDGYMNEYMNEHRGDSVVKTTEDEYDKVIYTDLHGNTIVSDMRKEPRDLNCSDKNAIQEEMEKLEKSSKQIINSNMEPEDKARELSKINQKRLDLFKDYGIEAPTVESEIKADQNIINDSVLEREQDFDDNDEQDFDDPFAKYAEGRIPPHLQ